MLPLYGPFLFLHLFLNFAVICRCFMQIRRPYRHPSCLLHQPQDQIEALGPYGPFLFVGVVTILEMVPLFPTQPLSLASGLLFGPQKVCLLS